MVISNHLSIYINQAHGLHAQRGNIDTQTGFLKTFVVVLNVKSPAKPAVQWVVKTTSTQTSFFNARTVPLQT